MMNDRQLNPAQETFRKKMSSHLLLRTYLFFNIPLGFVCGMKLTHLDQRKSISTVPFKWLNYNPFKSMYFGVQGMAAEISTGVMALMASMGHSPGLAVIVTGFESKFYKQAKDRIFFRCDEGEKLFQAVDQCIETQEGVETTVTTVGQTADGTIVSEFKFTWSFKQRK